MIASSRENLTLAEAQQSYRSRREAVHRATVMTLRQTDASKFSQLTITSITDRALESYQSQWGHAQRTVSWSWPDEVRKWHKSRPSYWDMAVWHKQTLCGLVLGGTSRRRSRLYVEGIEANPENNPLKGQIIRIALMASERYAEVIGCEQVWLVEPASGLVDQFKRAGYTVRPPSKFLAKVLRRKTFATKVVGGNV